MRSSVKQFLARFRGEGVRRPDSVSTRAMGRRRIFHAYDLGDDTFVFDTDPGFGEQLAARLDELFAQRGWTLFVPEAYGLCAPKALVLISSALSGGSLEGRLREAGERFGRDRLALALQRSAEDFSLPAPTGCGRPLSPEDLEKLTCDLRPKLHFSRPLCTRYFLYRRNDQVHLVLLDDRETIKEKLSCARACGVHRFLLPWRDISPTYTDFLPR